MPRADDDLAKQIRRGTHGSAVELGDRVQSLWGGYGELRRAEIRRDDTTQSVIVKHVTPPPERSLAASAEKLRSHRRKLRSYAVELAFYRQFAAQCPEACRVPALLHGEATPDRFLFVLEDLDAAGFALRRTRPSEPEIVACLAWLAAFHARFLHVTPEGLWKVGTYWHLATRSDELAALPAGELRRAAPRIDEQLNRARFQTFVHGDAKLENFCFSAGQAVAAVDFQYVGGGVGVKDLVYFLGSCLHPRECQAEVPRYLELYFSALRQELSRAGNAAASDAVEREWRELFVWAWVDFYRFLLGWAPGYAAGDGFSEQLTRDLLMRIR
ncbi:MAG: phosphotransferase [Polyangiaceae bacterium]